MASIAHLIYAGCAMPGKQDLSPPDDALQAARRVVLPRRETLLVFLAFFLLYAATISGDLAADSEQRWLVAERIVDTGWVAVEPHRLSLYAEGPDGRHYPIWPPGQPLCLTLFVFAGRGIAALGLPFSATPEMYGQFLATQIFLPGCGALTLLLVYLLVLEAGGDRRAARWITATVGLATMHWHYSISTGDETQVAVCVLTTLWAVLRAWRRPHWAYALLACTAAGAALWFRLTSAVVTGPLLLLGMTFHLAAASGARQRRQTARRWITGGLCGLLPFVAAMGCYHAICFGSPWATGYGHALRECLGGIKLFDTPLLVGAVGMLFSPGKGVFWFNPPLILALLGWFPLWRRDRRLALLIALPLLVSVCFHGCYTTWAGDLAWGPRYLASLMGLAMIAAVPLLQRKAARRALAVLLALSIPIQAASVLYSFGLEFFQDRRHGLIPDYVWRPEQSQLLCRFQNIALHLLGRPNHQSIPPQVVRPKLHQLLTPPEQVAAVHVVNIFPFKAYAKTGSRTLFAVLLVYWLALWVALVGVIWIWRRSLRSTRRPRHVPA